MWTLKTTYWWRQVFPAGRDLRIEHRYAPSLSNSNADFSGDLDDQGNLTPPEYFEKMSHDECLDPAVVKALVVKANERPYEEFGLGYVLTSGANWRGPIRDFRLVVDNPDPNVFLSFCAPGQHGPSPQRRVVWRRRDFIPKEDLWVGFYVPEP
jgi:hypothetical protein